MKQGMIKNINLNVEKMDYITVKVLALDRGKMNHPDFSDITDLTVRELVNKHIHTTDLMLRDKDTTKNANLLKQETTGDFVIWGDAYIEYITQNKDNSSNPKPELSVAN